MVETGMACSRVSGCGARRACAAPAGAVHPKLSHFHRPGPRLQDLNKRFGMIICDGKWVHAVPRNLAS